MAPKETRSSAARARVTRVNVRVAVLWRRRWVRGLAAVAAVPLVVLSFATAYYYVSFSRLIDARLHGERVRVLPRVFARPLELRPGQSLTELQLIDRLNDIGYAQRAKAEKPGEFAIGGGAVAIMPRAATANGHMVRVIFERQTPASIQAATRRKTPPKPVDHVLQIESAGKPVEQATLDAPVLTAIGGEREKRRAVSLSVIPPRMAQAVLAIEDRRFYELPGVDPIGMVGALVSNLRGKRA